MPLINGAKDLLEWSVHGPRWEFDERLNGPLAPGVPCQTQIRELDGGGVVSMT